jgi:ribosomal-protein-alanine N-acetyltransferase
VTAPDTVRIDALQPADAPRCAQLEALLFPGDDPWSASAFREELRAGHHYLAARSAGGARLDTARSAGGARLDTARSAGGARLDTARSAGGARLDTARRPDATAEEAELLVGYGGIAFVAGPPQAEAEIHTIGVDPAYRRRGLGRALLRGLLAVADAARATVFLEVRTDNEAARALYESEGFTAVGVRRNYYRPSGADAVTMRREARRDGGPAPAPVLR